MIATVVGQACLELFGAQLKHEVLREASKIPFHSLKEDLGGHFVERGKVGIEQDLMAALDKDGALDANSRSDHTFGHDSLFSFYLPALGGQRISPVCTACAIACDRVRALNLRLIEAM